MSGDDRYERLTALEHQRLKDLYRTRMTVEALIVLRQAFTLDAEERRRAYHVGPPARGLCARAHRVDRRGPDRPRRDEALNDG